MQAWKSTIIAEKCISNNLSLFNTFFPSLVKLSTRMFRFRCWLSGILVLRTHLWSVFASLVSGLSVSGQRLPEISKMSLVTSAGTAIVHYSKGFSLKDAWIQGRTFSSQAHCHPVSCPSLSPDIFCGSDMTFVFYYFFSVVTFTTWCVFEQHKPGGFGVLQVLEAGDVVEGGFSWNQQGGVLQHQSGRQRGSSGSPLLYKSTDAQVKSAINCYFSYF